MEVTVKDLRPLLRGPQDKLEITVAWQDDEFNITDTNSPVYTAFSNYVVGDVTCAQPFKFTIFLKQEYKVKEATA